MAHLGVLDQAEEESHVIEIRWLKSDGPLAGSVSTTALRLFEDNGVEVQKLPAATFDPFRHLTRSQGISGEDSRAQMSEYQLTDVSR